MIKKSIIATQFLFIRIISFLAQLFSECTEYHRLMNFSNANVTIYCGHVKSSFADKNENALIIVTKDYYLNSISVAPRRCSLPAL